MYIVQCVSSFLSLLQICKIHISHKKYIWKLKHCNNCLANKTFLAEKFKKLLPSEFGKVFSQLTWFKTFKLHLLHWKPVLTATGIQKNICGQSKTNLFFHYQLVTCTLIFRQLARALARADACGRWSTPPSPPLSLCHLAPPSSPLLVNCPPCLSLLILPILSHPLAFQFSPETTPLPLILPLLASVFQPPWNPLILLNLSFLPKKSLLWPSSFQYSSLLPGVLALFPLKDDGIWGARGAWPDSSEIFDHHYSKTFSRDYWPTA